MKGIMPFVVRFVHASGVVLLVFAVVACSLASMYFWQWTQRMPTATTLAGLARSQTSMVQLLYINEGDCEFYLWISTPISFGEPSEPTVYAFDRRGILLDWGLEADEWESIGYYYNKREQGVPLGIKEAIRRINNEARGSENK